MGVGQIDGVVRDLLFELGLVDAQGNPTASGLDGITNTTTGQLSWDAASGAIVHILGPSDETLFIQAPGSEDVEIEGNDITLSGRVNTEQVVRVGGNQPEVFLDPSASAGVTIASGRAYRFTDSTNAQTGTRRLGLTMAANGILTLDDGVSAGAALESLEVSAPSAPAANGWRLFAEEGGGGKTRLMVIFQSGAAQQIAIEP